MTQNPINNSEARKKSPNFYPSGWSTGFLDPKTVVVFSEPRPGREHAYNKNFFGSINFKNHDFRRQKLDIKKIRILAGSFSSALLVGAAAELELGTSGAARRYFTKHAAQEIPDHC